MNITYVLLLLPLLYQYTSADCGCGVRCMKYSSAKECTRCCTHSVRRSVPVFPDDEKEIKIYENKKQNIKIFDRELDEPVDEPSYQIYPRQQGNNEKNKLSKLISNLYIKERNYDSIKETRKTRRRSRLHNYYKVKRFQQKKNYDKEISQLLELLLKDTQSKERNYTKFRFSR